MEVLKNTRLNLWLLDSPRKRGRIMKTPFLPFHVCIYYIYYFSCIYYRLEVASNGSQNCLFELVIEEEVYIEQHQGFEVHDRETRVFKLKKALYGLK